MSSYFENQPTPSEIKERMKGYSSWLEINLDNIGNNLRDLQRHTDTTIMAVVKNNAYGHGLVPVTVYLESQGVEWCMVAKLYEALKLREAGLNLNILSMDVLFTPEQYLSVVEKKITQTIYTREDADKLQEAAEKAGKHAKVFIKVDTGLNRVGVRHSDAVSFIEYVHKLSMVDVEGIFSTFQQNPEMDKEMLDKLLTVDAGLKKKGINIPIRSMASTDATFHNPDGWLELVRPGMSLYGVYPEKKDLSAPVDLLQALSLKARIEYVKTVERGEGVTYWGKFVAPKRMRIGTIHAGFYDGVPREMANKGRILVNGVYKSSLGSVSLNHYLVDLDGVDAEKGTVVELIGETGENTLSKTAEIAGWMTYSLLNHLHANTPRVYYRGGEPVALLDPAH
ncbi:MAG: alanine racemase [Candidatus Bathyarchaeota archaeon]|nr:alanine racemase [Candidatus Bathyarchaeota archaeon]